MRRGRDSTKLVVGHLAACAIGPLLGTGFFMVLAFHAGDFAHFGGLMALLFALVFSYIFYAGKIVMLVILASPAFWLISKIRQPAVSYAVAVLAGAGLGWASGWFLFSPEESGVAQDGRLSSALTGVVIGLVLEYTWRSSACRRAQSVA